MANIIVINKHEPEECEAIFKAADEAMKEGLHPKLHGLMSYCSCPFGEHASWTVVDAPSAEEALTYLWPLEREHSRAVEVESMQIQ
jgi:hypothetical protein